MYGAEYAGTCGSNPSTGSPEISPDQGRTASENSWGIAGGTAMLSPASKPAHHGLTRRFESGPDLLLMFCLLVPAAVAAYVECASDTPRSRSYKKF